jgi:hypothetical protein
MFEQCDDCPEIKELRKLLPQIKQVLSFYANVQNYIPNSSGRLPVPPEIMKDQGRIARLTLVILEKRHGK